MFHVTPGVVFLVNHNLPMWQIMITRSFLLLFSSLIFSCMFTTIYMHKGIGSTRRLERQLKFWQKNHSKRRGTALQMTG